MTCLAKEWTHKRKRRRKVRGKSIPERVTRRWRGLNCEIVALCEFVQLSTSLPASFERENPTEVRRRPYSH